MNDNSKQRNIKKRKPIDKIDAIYICRAQVERWSEGELKANINYPPAKKELEKRIAKENKDKDE